jgi:hypothetical protein
MENKQPELRIIEGSAVHRLMFNALMKQTRKGRCMAQSHGSKRDEKKKPQKTPKEKRHEKQMKREGKSAETT